MSSLRNYSSWSRMAGCLSNGYDKIENSLWVRQNKKNRFFLWSLVTYVKISQISAFIIENECNRMSWTRIHNSYFSKGQRKKNWDDQKNQHLIKFHFAVNKNCVLKMPSEAKFYFIIYLSRKIISQVELRKIKKKKSRRICNARENHLKVQS